MYIAFNNGEIKLVFFLIKGHKNKFKIEQTTIFVKFS